MSSQQDKQINFLNEAVRVKIGPSKVSGVGIFAMRDIPKGSKLYGDMFPTPFEVPFNSFKKLLPEVREYIVSRWPRVVQDGGFMWPDVLWQAYMNHSDDPNYDCVKDITIYDIKAGEEIFEDYRRIENWEKAYPWLCTVDKK